MPVVPVRHISISIERVYAEVYRFLSEPANFSKWASGLGKSFGQMSEYEWVAETPLGPMIIRFSPPNEFGVLDHTLVPDSGPPMYNPMRVIRNGDGAEVVFSLFQRAGMSDEEVARDAAWVAKDLAALKELLEARGG